MNKFKVLITDDVNSKLPEGLDALGFEVDYRPLITLAECREIIQDYVGVVINTKIKADKNFIEKGKQLQFIARLGSGKDIIDLNAALDHNVHVITSPEGNRNAVGEHCLGMLLGLLNHICTGNVEVRKGQWKREKNRGKELSAMQVGIIGYGHTGSAFAQVLHGFGSRIYAYDKYKKGFGDHFVTECASIEQFIGEVDILSLHLPLTEETKYFANRALFEKMKSGSILINSSRGKVVHTADLVDALENQKLGGACLDVFENEKTTTFSTDEKELYSRLYRLSNVVLTPHIAGWTVESKQKIAEVLLHKIKAIFFEDQLTEHSNC